MNWSHISATVMRYVLNLQQTGDQRIIQTLFMLPLVYDHPDHMHLLNKIKPIEEVIKNLEAKIIPADTESQQCMQMQAVALKLALLI